MDIQAYINEVWPKLHALAEPAFKEVRTAAFLADFLRKLGYDVTENVGTTSFIFYSSGYILMLCCCFLLKAATNDS